MQGPELLAVIATSFIVSVIYNKISAAYTFHVIDGYVKEIIELAKNSIQDAKINE